MNVNQVIDALGGTQEVARLCCVTAGAVSQWRAALHIPPARLMYLRVIRPDVFDIYPNPTDGLPPEVADQQKEAA